MAPQPKIKLILSTIVSEVRMWCKKIIISSLIISTLSLLNIILCLSNSYSSSVSALGYETKTGVSFTFNPSLSLSISSLDLVIDNLTPGTTADSNSINISVSTNAAYGYTLSAITSNNNLTRSYDVSSVFNGIPTDANLENLATDNTWGYSTSLDNGSSWSNYNGLSSSSSTTLLDTNTNNTLNNSIDNIDFKIGAKAGSTQASGIYTNAINFTVVSKPIPVTLLDAFIAYNAKQYNGYYTMQSMTPEICSLAEEGSELQLIDIRDNKLYWVAKLKDGNCWMTQNLDLDLSHEIALTSETSDIDQESYGATIYTAETSDIDQESYGATIYTAETGYTKDEITGVVSWLPSTIDENDIQRANTIVMNGNRAPNWTNDYNHPYSADPGERCRYTNPSSYTESNYTSLATCTSSNGNDTAGCEHSYFGNYYNWPAAVATNDAGTAPNGSTWSNSICPKNWDLPAGGKYTTLMKTQGIYKSGTSYATKGFDKLRTAPLYFQRFGIINDGSLGQLGINGAYWSSTVNNSAISHDLDFSSTGIWPNNGGSNYGTRYFGISVRCVAQ